MYIYDIKWKAFKGISTTEKSRISRRYKLQQYYYSNSISFLALLVSLIKLLLLHFHSFSLHRGHILIATPGRLEDLLFRKKDGLDLGIHVKSLVSFQVLALIRLQLKQWIYE